MVASDKIEETQNMPSQNKVQIRARAENEYDRAADFQVGMQSLQPSVPQYFSSIVVLIFVPGIVLKLQQTFMLIKVTFQRKQMTQQLKWFHLHWHSHVWHTSIVCCHHPRNWQLRHDKQQPELNRKRVCFRHLVFCCRRLLQVHFRGNTFQAYLTT